VEGKVKNLVVSVIMTFAASSMANAELVGHWMLDETSGTIASDSSGNGNDAKLMGGLSFDSNSATGVIRKALALDGRDDYLVAESLSLPTDAFTIALWFNPNFNLDGGSNRMDLVYWGGLVKPYGDKPYLTFNKLSSGEIGIHVSIGQIEYDLSTKTNSWISSTWHHIAATFDGTDIKIYVNGILENTAAHPGTHYASNSVYFGIRTDGQYAFDGKLDDIRIYDRALTSDEIAQLGDFSPAFRKLIDEVREIETAVKEQSPREAIALLEKKISECEQWREKNPKDVGLYYKILFSDLYFLIAKAKEAGGLPKKDIVDAYEKATTSYNKAGEAFLWLFSNVSPERYMSIVKTFAQNEGHNYHNISKQLESGKNWPAFKLFLDTVFSSVEKPTAIAKSIGNGLSTWKKEYLEYCKSKAYLTEYIFEKDYKTAEQYIAKNDFKSAAEIYRNIIKQCSTCQYDTGIELKVCRCVLEAGDYQNAIIELGRFIDRNKSSDKKSVKEAVLMKSQCYIQLGDLNKALDEFAKLTAEYPEAKWTADFGFYTAYCYMLQGKGDKATEAFNFVIQNYPESNYANNARLCLSRIKNTMEKGGSK